MKGTDPGEIAQAIWPTIRQGNCVAWLGSGLSIPAGYPGWPEAVDQLCLKCRVQTLDSDELASPEALIRKAEDCKNADPRAYQETLADLFGGPVTGTRLAFHLLVALPFKAYVTTSFDPVLSEEGRVSGHTQFCSYPQLPVTTIEQVKGMIFYIHGHARRHGTATGKDLVLATSDFDQAYAPDGPVRQLLHGLLPYYDVLFMGCSLAEPDMLLAFEKVHGVHAEIRQRGYSQSTPQRPALLPARRGTIDDFPRQPRRDREKEAVEDNRLRQLGIDVIRYDPFDQDRHWEIEEVLWQMCRFADINVFPKLVTGPRDVNSL